jgi:hypothetical protein
MQKRRSIITVINLLYWQLYLYYDSLGSLHKRASLKSYHDFWNTLICRRGTGCYQYSFKNDYQSRLLEANEPIASPPDIVFETRLKSEICCPYCWTIQPSNRNFCRRYKCNAKFVFQDELGEIKYTSNESATFINITTSNIELPEKYLIMPGFNITFQ